MFIIIGIIIAVYTFGGIYFSKKVVNPNVYSRELLLKYETDNYRINQMNFNSLEKEEVIISSPYGYMLSGWFFPVIGSNKSVIICHGITCNVYTSVKYMDLFLSRGYNVLLYDHRNHGLSGGKNTTYGYFEKYDLKACTNWLFQKFGNKATIGIHGESMGAAIALLNTAIDSRISFCIADCPYSDLEKLLKFRLWKEYRLPVFPLYYITDLFAFLLTGMFFENVSPLKAIKNVLTPVFFIHGMEDDYIPTNMSIQMFAAKKGAKKLYIAPNARHTESYWNNKEEYNRLVGEFLQEFC